MQPKLNTGVTSVQLSRTKRTTPERTHDMRSLSHASCSRPNQNYSAGAPWSAGRKVEPLLDGRSPKDDLSSYRQVGSSVESLARRRHEEA